MAEIMINFVPDGVDGLSEPELDRVAELYARAFGGPPWYEVTRCPNDGQFYREDTLIGEPSKCCGEPLEEAYPRDTTIEYIRREMARRAATLYLLRRKGYIKGFTWGFTYESPEEFAGDKYRADETRAKVVEVLGRNGVTGAFFYLSESGIDFDVRGLGLSREMHCVRLERARNLGFDAVQRTLAGGPMYWTSSKLMTQIMGPQMTRRKDGLIVPTSEICGNVIDSENPSRVLFVKK